MCIVKFNTCKCDKRHFLNVLIFLVQILLNTSNSNGVLAKKFKSRVYNMFDLNLNFEL